MIEFPITFYALVAALWDTYQPTILIWMIVMFAIVVLLATGIFLSQVMRPILGR